MFRKHFSKSLSPEGSPREVEPAASNTLSRNVFSKPSPGKKTVSARTNWSILALCRLFLAIIVLNVHLVWFDANKVTTFLASFGGKAAVVGFLVISGFSVTSSLDRNPRKFLKRRFLRIYPAYLVAIAVAIILQFTLPGMNISGKLFHRDGFFTIACNVALLQMYACKAITFDPVTWSLSIEFSFYLLLSFLGRNNLKTWIFLTVVSLVHFLLPLDYSHSVAYVLLMKLNMVRYLWPFSLGVLLARTDSRFLFSCCSLAGVAFVFLSPSTPETLSWLTFVVTMFAIYLAREGAGRACVLFDLAGDISYPLYLLHLPLIVALFSLFKLRAASILVIAAFLAAGIVLALVERPFARTMRSLGSSRIEREERLLIT